MIRFTGVSKHYQKGTEQVQALADINLELNKGDYVALTGASGSGKSTMLALIGLMDTPTSGTIELLEQNINQLSDDARSKLRGQTIGFVFQSFNLLPQLRAWENVALPLKYQGITPTERKTRAYLMLEKVGLLNRAEHRPNELSGGQEQRVAIARALVSNPKLILADEPTGNLDAVTGQSILELLENLQSDGSTLVLVTHDPIVAARANKRIELRDGRIL